MSQQTAQEKIQSWKWRITKAGITMTSLSSMVGISSSQISLYCSGKVKPGVETFDIIEGKLLELGV